MQAHPFPYGSRKLAQRAVPGARPAMALLLTAGALALPAPAATSNAGGHGRQGVDRVAPGQARRAEPAAPRAAPAPPAPPATARPAVAPKPASGAARKSPSPGGANKPTPPGAAKKSTSLGGAKTSSTSGAKQSAATTGRSSAPGGGAKSSAGPPGRSGASLPVQASERAQASHADATPTGPAQSGGDAPAPAGSTQTASQTPATAGTSPAAAGGTAATPGPAGPASRAIGSATNVTGTRGTGRSSTRSAQTSTERSRSRSRRTPPAPAHRRTATTIDELSAATSAGPRDIARSGDATGRSGLSRTVVRVLEVIPAWVRVALAIGALLGVLLGIAAAVQTVRNRRLARQRSRLVADVGLLQSALLPALPERIGGARVTAAYRPAEGLAAGGDFYDGFALPGGRTAVLVGDIAGHGREVVPLTALVRYSLRAYLEAGLSPRATLHVAGNVLAAQLGGRQVTVAVAIFDPGSGRVTYACAGHGPPLLLHSSATPVTACSSPPIGAGAPTGRRQTTVALDPGAAACFHTDGLDEARIAGGRLGRDGVARELRVVGARGDASELIERVARRSERQDDDMAVCMITALSGGAAGWSLQLEELEVDARALDAGLAERFLVACGSAKPQIAKAHHEARAMIARCGTAVVEVRVGEALADVRVRRPPAVTLPIGRAAGAGIDLVATG